MLILPESREPFRVLALDPGSHNTGFAKWEWDFESPTFRLEDAFTRVLKDTNPTYNAIRELHGLKIARMHEMADQISEVIQDFRPHAIVCESNFMGRFAAAFAALTEAVAVIRNVVYTYDRYMPLNQIDPITVKKAVGVVIDRKKKSDKEDVRRALAKRTDIEWCVDLNSLDEHGVDASAIGLWYLLQLATV